MTMNSEGAATVGKKVHWAWGPGPHSVYHPFDQWVQVLVFDSQYRSVFPFEMTNFPGHVQVTLSGVASHEQFVIVVIG